MVSYEVPKSQMVQTDLPYSNVVFNSQEGILYSPQKSGKVVAQFSKTFNPAINQNFAWDHVILNWTRDAPATPLTGFEARFTLEGILPNGVLDVIAEEIITTIPTTPTTEDILFDLKSGRAMASLTKTNVATASTGKVQVDLPKRYMYYDSVTLDRFIPSGWTRMNAISFLGPSTAGSGVQLKKILIPYDADMKADFSDLRFLDTDGRFFLCYNVDSKVNSSYAIVTVLIPSMPATPAYKTIYVIYGNSSTSAPGSSFTSEAIGSDEPDLYQTVYKSDNFDDASIGAIWTVSGGVGAVAEVVGTLDVAINSGVASSGFSNCPVAYTGIPTGDFQFTIKFDNATLEGDVSGGIFIGADRANLKALTYWRSASDMNYYMQSPTGDNTAVTGGAYYLRITYRNLTYTFEYSPTGLPGTYTTIYSTTSLGFTPLYVGVFAHHWNDNHDVAFNFDDFSIKTILGTESDLSDPSLEPDTAAEDDTSLLFTLTSDWINGCVGCLNITEARSTPYETPDVNINPRDVFKQGYDGVDHYSAIRLTGQIIADNTCNIRINSEKYGFEV